MVRVFKVSYEHLDIKGNPTVALLPGKYANFADALVDVKLSLQKYLRRDFGSPIRIEDYYQNGIITGIWDGFEGERLSNGNCRNFCVYNGQAGKVAYIAYSVSGAEYFVVGLNTALPIDKIKFYSEYLSLISRSKTKTTAEESARKAILTRLKLDYDVKDMNEAMRMKGYEKYWTKVGNKYSLNDSNEVYTMVKVGW